MKRRLIWLIGAGILLVFNGLIIHKELFLARGDSIYLELAPVDPRSLMQGDYMELNYIIGDEIRRLHNLSLNPSPPRQGRVVISTDLRGIARLERIDDDVLHEGERFLKWKEVDSRIVVGTNAYFFQEGRDREFQNARYGEVKIDRRGSTLLVRLLNGDLLPLE